VLVENRVVWELPPEAHLLPLPETAPYLRQKPDRRTFGIRLHARAHATVAPERAEAARNRRASKGKEPGGMRYWLTDGFGEAPAVVDAEAVERTRRSLEAVARETGFLQADVQAHPDTLRRRGIRMVYTVASGPLWTVGAVRWDTEGSGISEEQARTGSRLTLGVPFDVRAIEAERARIAAALQSAGYAGFDEAYVKFVADTLGRSTAHAVDLEVVVLPRAMGAGGEAAPIPHRRARFGEIRILQDAAFGRKLLRPEVLEHCIAAESGMRYNRLVLEQSYRRIMALPAVARVEIPTVAAAGHPDGELLDVEVRIAPRPRLGWAAEIDFTRTDARYGPLARMTWTDRNASGRGDMLEVAASGGILSTRPFSYSEASLVPNSGEWSAEVRYAIPGVPPFPLRRFRPSSAPRSDAAAAFRRESRPDYVRKTLAVRHGFSWVENPERNSTIQVDVLEATFTDIAPTDAFTAWLAGENNAFLSSRFQDYAALLSRITWGTGWGDGQGSNRISVEWAGQALRALAPSLGLAEDAGQYRVAGVPFAQYFRVENEFRWSRIASEGGTFAARLFTGAGLPGANLGTLPYDRSFYGGGVNGLRGWATRDLGPGSTGGGEVQDGVVKGLGDIRMEVNAEFRQELTDTWGLALFAEAGNVWLSGDAPAKSTWKGSGGFASIAADFGLGIRWDFGFFLLRIDGGLRAHDPGKAEGARWIGQGPLAGAVHLGIGHPF
jgi:outer membrane protein assembly factor BamA